MTRSDTCIGLKKFTQMMVHWCYSQVLLSCAVDSPSRWAFVALVALSDTVSLLYFVLAVRMGGGCCHMKKLICVWNTNRCLITWRWVQLRKLKYSVFFLYVQFPYYSFVDRSSMYKVGSLFYAIYFIVSFPMFIR